MFICDLLNDVYMYICVCVYIVSILFSGKNHVMCLCVYMICDAAAAAVGATDDLVSGNKCELNGSVGFSVYLVIFANTVFNTPNIDCVS